jgi:hypothetical protein
VTIAEINIPLTQGGAAEAGAAVMALSSTRPLVVNREAQGLEAVWVMSLKKISDWDFGGPAGGGCRIKAGLKSVELAAPGPLFFRQLVLARGWAFLGAVSKSRYVRAAPRPGGQGLEPDLALEDGRPPRGLLAWCHDGR